MPLKILSIAIPVLLAAVLLNSCNDGRRRVSEAVLLGTYTFKSDAPISVPASQGEPRLGDHLILSSDGTYIIEGRQPRGAIMARGKWRLRKGNPSTVELDHAVYPVEFREREVRLIVNDDVDARYEQIR